MFAFVILIKMYLDRITYIWGGYFSKSFSKLFTSLLEVVQIFTHETDVNSCQLDFLVYYLYRCFSESKIHSLKNR